MAATCGVGMNSVVAEGMDVLGDVRGGAISPSTGFVEALVADQADIGDLRPLSHTPRGNSCPG